AEHIERLLRDPKGAAIAGGADHTRTGEAVHDALERVIDFRRSGNLVADKTPLRRVAIQPATIEDRLACDPIPGETPQPELCSARNAALLRRRYRHIGAPRRQHVIPRQQELTAAADRKTLDHADPGLFGSRADELVGTGIMPSDAAEKLVDEPHVAPDVP